MRGLFSCNLCGIVLFPPLETLLSKDIDLVLMPKRVLSFGAPSVADMTSAGLLVGKGRKLAYVSLGDA